MREKKKIQLRLGATSVPRRTGEPAETTPTALRWHYFSTLGPLPRSARRTQDGSFPASPGTAFGRRSSNSATPAVAYSVTTASQRSAATELLRDDLA